MSSPKKTETPKPSPNQKLSKEKQWENFDKAKTKLFGPKKGDGSNRS